MNLPNKRNLLFAVIAVAGFFLILEAAFRWTEYAWEDRTRSPIAFQELPDPLFTVGPENKSMFVNMGHDGPQLLDIPKKQGVFRIYVFGGSAAMGMGFPHNGAFADRLNQIIKAACPSQSIEVIKLASVGYSSRQVLGLVREVLAKGEPDLLVVYSGNNEYLDEKARMAMDKAYRSHLAKWRLALEKNLALARFLASFAPRPKELDINDSSILSGYRNLPLSPKQISQIHARYERNLTSIVTEATKRNVKTMLCTLIADPMKNLNEAIVDRYVQDFEDLIKVQQAVGWARLGRWDIGHKLLQTISNYQPHFGLLEVAKFGGIRNYPNGEVAEGSDSLAHLARERLLEIENVQIQDEATLLQRAVCYKILGQTQKLNALLASLSKRFGGYSQERLAQTNVLFGQFRDEPTYIAAFDRLWSESIGGVIANPVTNGIVRKVVKRTGAILIDADEDLADWKLPTPRRYLVDYCHLNIEGAYKLAGLVFREMIREGLLKEISNSNNLPDFLLSEDLAYLRKTAHDFTGKDKWMGHCFRVCYCYSPPLGNPNIFREWFDEDKITQTNQDVIGAFEENFRIFAGD